jgi:hypothetical protein
MFARLKWVLLFIFIIDGKDSFCQTPFILTDSIEQMGMKEGLIQFLEDSQNKLSIQEVSSSAFTGDFHTADNDHLMNSNKQATYWLRFTLINHSHHSRWLMEMFDHNINSLSIFYPSTSDTYIERSSGNSFYFKHRDYQHKNFEFDLDLKPGQKKTYYLKIRSNNNNILTPEIRSYSRFISYALYEYYVFGIFYGILLIMAIYNLMLFLTVKNKSYLYYALYTLSVALYSMSQNGLGFQFLWPDHPEWNPYALYLSIASIILFFILFSKVFLSIPVNYPKLNQFLNSIIGIRILILFIGIYFYDVLLKHLFLDLIPLMLVYMISCIIFIKEKKVSAYFLLASTLLIFTFAINILEHYGLITSTIITVYSINIGIVLDILFFSVSLAEGYRREINMTILAKARLVEEMKAKELLTVKINQELEEKVVMRTSELYQANEKLKEQALSITQMNLKLDLLNRDLQKDIIQTNQKGILKTHMGFDEFLSVYPDELSCYRFIEELKSKRSFSCKKCLSLNFGKGKVIFDRRCTKCGYNESITSNTIFHKIKFPIVKSFYIIYLIANKPNTTAEDISAILNLRKETCSAFKKKVLERMKSVPKKDLESWDILILNAN